MFDCRSITCPFQCVSLSQWVVNSAGFIFFSVSGSMGVWMGGWGNLATIERSFEKEGWGGTGDKTVTLDSGLCSIDSHFPGCSNSSAKWNRVKENSSMKRWMHTDRRTERTGSIDGCLRRFHWRFDCVCMCVCAHVHISIHSEAHRVVGLLSSPGSHTAFGHQIQALLMFPLCSPLSFNYIPFWTSIPLRTNTHTHTHVHTLFFTYPFFVIIVCCSAVQCVC